MRMKQSFFKLLLLLAWLMPLPQAIANIPELPHQLAHIDQATCQSIIELKNLLPDYNWSETFKNLCLDIKDGGNVALHEQLDCVVNECLAVLKDQFHPLETVLADYKTNLDSGHADIQVDEIDSEQATAQFRKCCTTTCAPKVCTPKICTLSIRNLRVNGSLVVNGPLTVNGNEVVTGTLTVNSSLTVAGDATFGGPVTIDGCVLECTDGALTVDGATFGSSLGYGYVYALTAQTVAIEAPVLFDTNGPLLGVTHTPASPSIVITSAGTYLVNFSVSGTEPNQFAIFINGAPNTSTVYGSGAGTQQNSGQSILVLPAGATLTLVNHSSTGAVTLASVVGGTQANVTASVLIQRLA